MADEAGHALVKQGMCLHLSGIRHPQTQGKVVRFHGPLEKARRLRGLPEPALRQRWLDDFRQDYNHVRPHEALGMQTPATLWQPSPNPYDPDPPPWQYPDGAELHRLEKTGQLTLNGRRWQVAGALASEQVRLIRIEQRMLEHFSRGCKARPPSSWPFFPIKTALACFFKCRLTGEML